MSASVEEAGCGTTPSYRREIDGLRAVAVLPVIAFHAGFEAFAGGYVGVDVFFVISGYLITSVLLADRRHGRFSLLHFYERRARRLLPALALVMLCCLPFAWAWMLPDQLRDFGRSLIAVPLFVSNVLFWSESGYFAAASEEKPLLHTWSLAVEEQYYVVYPLLLWLLWPLGLRRFGIVLGVLTLASLGLAEWSSRAHPSAAFYLAPARAWELFAGALCGLHQFRRGGLHASHTLSLVGLAGIAAAVLLFDEATPFPSLYTLIPVAGTVCVILFGSETTWAGRILSTRALVGIGLTSYSAYLWHQPLFAFARLQSAEPLSSGLLLALAGASLLLAWPTWRWVETPFRDRTRISRRGLFTAAAAASGAFVLSGGIALQFSGFPERGQMAALDSSWDPYTGCSYPTRGYRQVLCGPELRFATEARERKILFVGDSMLTASASGILEAARRLGIEVNLAARWACPAVRSATRIRDGEADARCAEFNERVFRLVREEGVTDLVLFSAFNRYLRNGLAGRSEGAPCSQRDACNREFANALRTTLGELRDAGIRVGVVRQPPDFRVAGIHSLQRSFLQGGAEAVSIPRRVYEDDSQRFLEIIGARAALVDPSEIFCDTTHCSPLVDGRMAYVNGDHLGLRGSRALAGFWEQTLAEWLDAGREAGGPVIGALPAAGAR